MGKEDLTSGLGPKEIGKLFRICSEREPDNKAVSSDQRQTELLLDHLASTILLEKSIGSNLSVDIRHLCKLSGVSAFPTVRELLATPQIRLGMIRKLKKIYQDFSQSSKSKAELDVATAIYYAAIGYALIYHKKRITGYSYEELAGAFTKFGRIKWISQDLQNIYKEAQEYCCNRAATDDK